MRVEVPPQVIPAAAARVRPTSYVYVPGLARDNLVLTPCRDIQEFLTKIRNTFGLRRKTIWQGSEATNEVDDDAFMTGAVTALCSTKGAIPLDCGHALRWVAVRSRQPQSKAFQILGVPTQNLLAMKPGNKPTAPKATLYGFASQSQPCLADECMATSKGNVLVANNQNQAQANEAKPLALLQADDMLYVVGHGSALGASLTYKCPPPASHLVKDGARAADGQSGCGNSEHLERWYCDANTLAALLIDEGLPTTHQNIEMVMCFGAGLSISSEQTVQPFCQRLAVALSNLGYKQIKVRGARGLVIGADLSINPSLIPRKNHLVIDPAKKVLGNEKLIVTFTGK
jgi:hypothetical protein